jgi:O-antigen ligase
MDFFTEFSKVIVLYLLVVGIVNTPTRLRRFLVWLVIIDLVPTSLALLHARGIITIPAYTAVAERGYKEGELVEIQRLVATGFYGDPNDFCEVINPGLLFCVAGLLEPLRGIKRLVWLVPIATFGQALFMTQSRGGFLGSLTGLSTVFWSRFGWRKAIMLMVLALPLLFAIAGPRMSSISTSENTGQERVQVWLKAISYFIGSPVVGVGTGHFTELTRYVCHNAYMHAYVELGLLGGTLVFACYFSTLSALVTLGRASKTDRPPEFQRLRPYVLGALISYALGEMSLTHPYDVPTYAMLGLATACVSLGDPEGRISGSVLTARGFLRMLGASALFLAALYLFVMISVN